MSRSNNPQMHAAGRERAGSIPPEQDPLAWTQGQRAQRPSAPQPYYPPQHADGQHADPYAPPQGYYPQAPAPDPYAAPAPQHRPYVPPPTDTHAPGQPHAYGGPGGYGAEPHFGSTQAYDQWPAAAPAQDYRSFDLNSYGGPAGGQSLSTGYGQPAPHADGADWRSHDPYAQPMPGPSFGDQVYAQPHGGALEQAYAEEEVYEAEERPRRRRGLKIVAVLAGAIMVGGGLAYSYSALLGPSSDANTPVVKSADGPFKVKPSEPGGKQFAHSDSKIMGRLGEGATGAGAATAATEASSAEAASGTTDPVTGARKVPILVVGRDGSIQPPAATEAADPPRAVATTATVAVPGMTIIDGLGGAPAASKPAAPKVIAAAEPEKPVVVNPPGATQKKSESAAAAPAARPQSSSDSTDTIAAVASEKKPAAKKATSTAAAASSPAPSGAGFVAVLASVPASSSSRINALQKFADMQQKYGTLLQDKTPDVQEANLGDKGTYHRLLVGPPGSRDSANALCTQLKAQGYSDCWVTAY